MNFVILIVLVFFIPAYPAGVKLCRCCSSILGRVCRYELPGINAFNFVLEDALGGGGVTSLRSDPQVTLATKEICISSLVDN